MGDTIKIARSKLFMIVVLEWVDNLNKSKDWFGGITYFGVLPKIFQSSAEPTPQP